MASPALLENCSAKLATLRIGTDGVARISVRSGMLTNYPDLEVSVQDPGKGYQYSNVSVLRGSVA